MRPLLLCMRQQSDGARSKFCYGVEKYVKMCRLVGRLVSIQSTHSTHMGVNPTVFRRFFFSSAYLFIAKSECRIAGLCWWVMQDDCHWYRNDDDDDVPEKNKTKKSQQPRIVLLCLEVARAFATDYLFERHFVYSLCLADVGNKSTDLSRFCPSLANLCSFLFTFAFCITHKAADRLCVCVCGVYMQVKCSIAIMTLWLHTIWTQAMHTAFILFSCYARTFF